MAEDETRRAGNVDEDRKAKELKYLDFVQAATLYIIVCLARLYEYARENSGPLKPGVHALEGSVKFVIAPVCRKFHGAPFNLLQFLDGKVDESIQRMDGAVKKTSNQAAKKTPAAASEGYARCSPTAKDLYAKYEPAAVEYAVLAWRVVQWIPVVGQVTRVGLPVVKYGVGIYNWGVRKAKRRGYAAANYIPEVPTERIAKQLTGKSKVN